MPRIRDIQFIGLIASRDLRAVTHNELANAFARQGWKEASHTNTPHFCHALVGDGPGVGVLTLAHFARAMRDGFDEPDPIPGRLRRWLPTLNAYAVVGEARGELFTFTPGRFRSPRPR